MTGQMTIFDWWSVMPMETPDINDITEAEAVSIVSQRIGVPFTYDGHQWNGKVGKLRLDMRYSHFTLNDNHDLYLGVGYSYRLGGGGSPLKGIDKAVEYFRDKIERYGKG